MSSTNLNDLFVELTAEAAQEKSVICVFDLDSTLFNVSTRSEKILHEFAVENKKIELLKISILLNDWGIYEALLRAGYLRDQHPELHDSLKKYWGHKFFSHEYIHYDVPYIGAVYFVQQLHLMGVNVHYLTGRDVERMGRGTAEVLIKWGFPYREDMLHLKPHKSHDDEIFKLDWVKKLKSAHPESRIYLFENEPVNINHIGESDPDVKIVYMNTTHSRLQTVRVPHIEISNFVLEGI